MPTLNAPYRHPSTVRRRLIHLAASAGLLLVSHQSAQAISIYIDDSHDDLGFFSAGSDERMVLDAAASAIGSLFVDELDAISPDSSYIPIGDPGWPNPGNSWRAIFEDPSDVTQSLNEDFLTIPANTLHVFVGADDFTGGQLAQGGFGGNETFGTAAFNASAKNRGESGEASTWGGSISVDSAGTTWDLSIDGSTLGAGEHHLYSVLLHEFGHVLGLGTHPTWHSFVSANEFTGTEAVASFGSNVPLVAISNDHFDDGLSSTIYGTSTSQEPSLSADIGANEIKLLTDLDVAALEDIGWELAPVPEPSTSLLLVSLLGLLARRRRPLV